MATMLSAVLLDYSGAHNGTANAPSALGAHCFHAVNPFPVLSPSNLNETAPCGRPTLSLDAVSTFGVVFGAVLVAATGGSLSLQHHSMLSSRSSEGVSVTMLFLANVNQFVSVLNIFVMKFVQLQACAHSSVKACVGNQLSTVQMLVLWVLYYPLFMYWLWFCPTTTQEDRRAKRRATWMFRAFNALMVLLSAAAYFLLSYVGLCGITVDFACLMGWISTVVTIIQWTPQILTTYRAKSGGALSVLMIAINVPGSFVIVGYLKFISHEPTMVWFSTFVSGCQQGVLLVLLLWYQFCAPKKSASLGAPILTTQSGGGRYPDE